MRIQHNITAMNAYRNYNNNTSALAKNLEKLSSGYKINRAGDDAAGLAISEKMRAQISGLEAASKNVKDGISLVKTAEGAMQEIQDMLNRMDYLATQSANGTYDNEVDRLNLQKEVDALKTEINRIADSANFNGIKLLDGSMSNGKGIDGKTLYSSFDLPAVGGVKGTDTILHQDETGDGKGTRFSIDLNDTGFKNEAGKTMKIELGDKLTIELTGDGKGAMDANDIVSAIAQGGSNVKFNGQTVATSANGVTIQIGGQDFKIEADANNAGRLNFTQVKAPVEQSEVINGAMSVKVSGDGVGIAKHKDGAAVVLVDGQRVNINQPIELSDGSSLDLSSTKSNAVAIKNALASLGTAGGKIEIRQWSASKGEYVPMAANASAPNGVQYAAFIGNTMVGAVDITAGSTGTTLTVKLFSNTAEAENFMASGASGTFASLVTGPEVLKITVPGATASDADKLEAAVQAANAKNVVIAQDEKTAVDASKGLDSSAPVQKPTTPPQTATSTVTGLTSALTQAGATRATLTSNVVANAVASAVKALSGFGGTATGASNAATVAITLTYDVNSSKFKLMAGAATIGVSATVAASMTSATAIAIKTNGGATLATFNVTPASGESISGADVAKALGADTGAPTVGTFTGAYKASAAATATTAAAFAAGAALPDKIRADSTTTFTLDASGLEDGIKKALANASATTTISMSYSSDTGTITLATASGTTLATATVGSYTATNGGTITFKASDGTTFGTLIVTKGQGVATSAKASIGDVVDKFQNITYTPAKTDPVSAVGGKNPPAYDPWGGDPNNGIALAADNTSYANASDSPFEIVDNTDKANWNVSTTVIQNVDVESGKRRDASTQFTLTNRMVEDGASIKIGNTVYEFTTKEADKGLLGNQHAAGAANAKVYIGDLDKNASDYLSKVAERLTHAAKNNDVWDVGHDDKKSAVINVHEREIDGQANTSEADGKLDTMASIKKSLGFKYANSELTLQIGDTSDSFNQLKLSIGDMHTAAMGIADVDISTQAGAQSAIETIKNAINYVSGVRGDLGATQNRLEHTGNNLSVMRENIQDAESTIRDTDVAEEMMSYVKNNILVQSAQAMLAQANQLPQGVLQLLG